MFDLRIRSNISEVINFVRNQPYFVKKRIKSNLKLVGRYIQRESRKNAPYKTGALRRGIQYKVSGDKVVIFVRGKAEDYAYFMENGEYKRGRGTIRKGGRAGRLFIQRATESKQIENMMGDIYK